MVARSFKNKEGKGKENKKRLSKPAIFAIIIGAVMILSTIGFSLTGSFNQDKNYNGYRLVRADNYWMLEIIDDAYLKQHPTKAKLLKPIGYPFVPKKQLFFSQFPSDISGLKLDKNALGRIGASKMIYISFYPNQTDSDAQYVDFARFQLSKDLMDNFKIYSSQALAVDEQINKDLPLPVINCENATAAVPVLLIRTKQENASLTLNGNCILMDANQGYELAALRDKIVYQLLGVIEE